MFIENGNKIFLREKETAPFVCRSDSRPACTSIPYKFRTALIPLRPPNLPMADGRRVGRPAGGEGRRPRDASCTSRWGTKGNRKLSLFICKTGVTWAKKRFLSGVCSVICCHSHFAYVGEGPRTAIVASSGPARNMFTSGVVLSTSFTFYLFLYLLEFVGIFFPKRTRN